MRIKMTADQVINNPVTKKVLAHIKTISKQEVEEYWLNNESSSTQLRDTLVDIISRCMQDLKMPGKISLDGQLGMYLSHEIIKHFDL